MNVRLLVDMDGGVWRTQLSLESGGMTHREQHHLAEHGPFSVDIGGHFSGDDVDDVTLMGIEFDLDPDSATVPADFPLVQEFAPLDSLDVEMGPRAAIWGEIMLSRLTDALTAWLEIGESWERDTVHTIP